MSDIVERLRSSGPTPSIFAVRDAADEIERLRAELAVEREKKAAIIAAFDEVSKVEFSHDGLSSDLHEVKDKAHAYIEGWTHALACLHAAIDAARGKE